MLKNEKREIKKWCKENKAAYRMFYNTVVIYYNDESWEISKFKENAWEVRHSQGRDKLHAHRQMLVDDREHISAVDYILNRVIKTHNNTIRRHTTELDKMNELFDMIN